MDSSVLKKISCPIIISQTFIYVMIYLRRNITGAPKDGFLLKIQPNLATEMPKNELKKNVGN